MFTDFFNSRRQRQAMLELDGFCLRDPVARHLIASVNCKETKLLSKSTVRRDKASTKGFGPPQIVRTIYKGVEHANAHTGALDDRRKLGEYKLHIVLDVESLAKLRWLQANLEATSESEVIRRALRAYELFEPDDVESNISMVPNVEMPAPATDHHLYVRITNRMKDEMDRNGEENGLSYAQQVRHALRVLMQITREVDAYKGDRRNTDDLRPLKGISSLRLVASQ